MTSQRILVNKPNRGHVTLHQFNRGKLKIGLDALKGTEPAKIVAQRRWDAYIAAMRGIMSSHPMDVSKADAFYAHLRAEERFFADRQPGRAARRAYLLQLILGRTGNVGGG